MPVRTTRKRQKKQPLKTPEKGLRKAATGISGFDEISGGGLPAGRPTLVCGAAGCGKSLFALEFLMRGAVQFGEAGVLMTFEETAEDIRKDVASLGFDVEKLVQAGKLVIDHVHVSRNEIDENGEYDLEGLFIRLEHAVATVGARRVVLDTIEALFSGFSDEAILRAELRRLFTWVKERGLTTVITGERGEGALTRQGLEEYVSDCVILLDHRVQEQVSTRRLRIVKYRGSFHGTNEYPFLIDQDGISVLPITASSMDYAVSEQRMPSGIPALDDMLGGEGFYRGSMVLVTGTAGTGKSSIAAHVVNSACGRGERCLYFSFEESPAQIVRNMRSIGLKLEPHVRRGLLEFHSTRPTVYGLEMHLVRMFRLIDRYNPSVVILDPITNLRTAGTLDDSTNMLIRLVDLLRRKSVTGILLGLSTAAESFESTDEGLSSMVDSWLLLRDVEQSGERNRVLYVLKSRGMAHSNQIREFHIGGNGIKLIQPYLGTAGVLTGTARLAQEERDRVDQQQGDEEADRKRLAYEHRRKAIAAQIAVLRAEAKAEAEEFARENANTRRRTDEFKTARTAMLTSRKAT